MPKQAVDKAVRAPYHNKIPALVSALLPWFAQNARPLPWRETRDPYAIWVSEIMLQQTQVKTVIPYFERWMRALPTIADLAAASSETLHKLWEGLGYYTRVRNLQKAAQFIMQSGGQFPRDHAAILELPGIGRYTAGAIASIAFNQPHPILDGNVIRVLTRVFGITENPRDKTTNELLWQLADKLVLTADQLTARGEPHALPLTDARPTLNIKLQTLNFGACSALNQSLMELGALICTPRQPKCPDCPVRAHCEADRKGIQHLLPNLAPRAAVTERHFIAFVIEHRGKFLVRQRPASQVNAHLWEFPNIETVTGARTACPRESISDKTRTSFPPSPALLAEEQLGLELKNLRDLCTIRHTITRYRITLRVFRADMAPQSKIKNQKSKIPRLPLAELHQLPFTSAHRKILKLLELAK